MEQRDGGTREHVPCPAKYDRGWDNGPHLRVPLIFRKELLSAGGNPLF